VVRSLVPVKRQIVPVKYSFVPVKCAGVKVPCRGGPGLCPVGVVPGSSGRVNGHWYTVILGIVPVRCCPAAVKCGYGALARVILPVAGVF